MFLVLCVTVNIFPVTRNIFSFTRKRYCGTRWYFLFLSQEINVLSQAQEIFFLSQEKNSFVTDITHSFCHRRYSSCFPVRGFVPPLAMSIHLTHTNSIFPVTRTIFLVRENSFLRTLGHLRCLTFSRQMRRIYNQNFLWDLKIFVGTSWYSALVGCFNKPTNRITIVYVQSIKLLSSLKSWNIHILLKGRSLSFLGDWLLPLRQWHIFNHFYD